MDPSHLDCVLKHSRSQWSEDKALLPLLLHAARHKPGTFVELGALDGLKYSNTLALEACFNWTGLLIEANPANAALLFKSNRTATAVHSAVCPDGVGTYEVSSIGGPGSGNLKYIFDGRAKTEHKHAQTVMVPCKPLWRLLADAGMPHGATFLSLDVEGAEPAVLATLGSASFEMALIEVNGHAPAINQYRKVLNMRAVDALKIGGGSSLFARPSVLETAGSTNYTILADADEQARVELTACVLKHASFSARMLLPALAVGAYGRQGTFVEVGTKRMPSFTAVLERCYGWRGVLVGRTAEDRDAWVAVGRRASIVIAAGGVCAERVGGSRLMLSATPDNGAPSPAETAPCQTLPAIMRSAGLHDGATFLAVTSNYPTTERIFEPPAFIPPEKLPRHRQHHFPNGTWGWPAPTSPATFQVLTVPWHGPGAWERCASCRIGMSLRLVHDRRLSLATRPTEGTRKFMDLRAYTREDLCHAAPMGKGVRTCFIASHGMSPDKACGFKSETRDCAWSDKNGVG